MSRSGGLGTAVPVLIVDDHELYAVSLTLALRQSGIPARRARMSSVASILHSAGESDPGLVVLDLHLGQDENTGEVLSPVALCRQLRAAGWRVLVVSGGRDEDTTASAIAAGAVGALPKSSSFDTLVSTVGTATTGRPVMTERERGEWLGRHFVAQRERQEAERRIARLSRREREVLQLLVQGRRAAQVAEHFTVSLTTVRTQIRAILSKLECNSQIEAVALASRWMEDHAF